MDITNKNILLTGASSGIGKELLNILSKYEGVKIIAIARNIDTISAIENKIHPYSADLSTTEGIDKVFEYAESVFDCIDIFIANAGFAYIEELKKPDWNHLDKIYSLNVLSVIYSLQKFDQQAQNKERQFVCTISAVAFVPLYAYTLYCSSKAALHQFIESYRMEKADNLILSAIYPVATKTSFFDRASNEEKTPLPFPSQSVEVVAKKIVKGIEKNKKRIYPSRAFSLLYPIGRAFPFTLRIYSWAEKRKVKRWMDAK